ncbi:MAG: hypothetical protein DCF28_13580 [Alphaproteobacteria bacterium]|nr:MAG: hypothetical protein DCF28_13580 [Alphaproteobacteria bacterium]PZO36592.1 MAG: hypothetical protein DCE92_08710 [Alphaproteobacteria bacterium]
MLIAAAILLLTQNPVDRTAEFSPAYQACERAAPSMIESRDCLAVELRRQQVALDAIARNSIEPETQALWEMSVAADCAGEYEMGGNGADMRANACRIGLTIARIRYLQVRGTW